MSDIKIGLYRVMNIEQAAAQTYVLRLDAPDIAEAASAGQFVMVRTGLPVDMGGGPLLKRPFSLHCFGPDGSVSLLFKVVGTGTNWLAHVRPGDVVEVMGPLGRGFVADPDEKQVCLVGGGIGIAPLLALSESLPGHVAQTLIYGTRTQAEIIGNTHLKRFKAETIIMTEDGTCGRAGLVTEPLQEVLEKKKIPIYACGPQPMLAAVADLTGHFGVPAQVSLEAHMACGMGACLGCVVPSAAGGYIRVCAEGPVFKAEEVSW